MFVILQGDQSTLFSDDPWKVQIRLRAEDEEVLHITDNLEQKYIFSYSYNFDIFNGHLLNE